MKLLSERYLGGRVTFKSAPGLGTVFKAVYPRNLDGAAPALSPGAKPDPIC